MGHSKGGGGKRKKWRGKKASKGSLKANCPAGKSMGGKNILRGNALANATEDISPPQEGKSLI